MAKPAVVLVDRSDVREGSLWSLSRFVSNAVRNLTGFFQLPNLIQNWFTKHVVKTVSHAFLVSVFA